MSTLLATLHAAHSRIYVPYVPRHRSPLAPNQSVVAYLPRHSSGRVDAPSLRGVVDGPHSRACGFRRHEHGQECHQNCPTCHGDAA